MDSEEKIPLHDFCKVLERLLEIRVSGATKLQDLFPKSDKKLSWDVQRLCERLCDHYQLVLSAVPEFYNNVRVYSVQHLHAYISKWPSSQVSLVPDAFATEDGHTPTVTGPKCARQTDVPLVLPKVGENWWVVVYSIAFPFVGCVRVVAWSASRSFVLLEQAVNPLQEKRMKNAFEYPTSVKEAAFETGFYVASSVRFLEKDQ